MFDGWIKLHRKLLSKPIWKNSTSDQRSILIAILLMANHVEKKWEWQGKLYICKSGEFVTSLASIAELAGKSITTQNVRSALLRFEKLEFLTNQSTKTGRLINIINWGDYQYPDYQPNKDINKDPTKTQQRPNKDLTTNNNERMKECKNKKRNIKEKKNDAAKLIFDNYISKIHPIHKTTDQTLSNIAKHLESHSKESLMAAIENYQILAVTKEPQYRKNPANFFGVKKGNRFFVDFLPENYVPQPEQEFPVKNTDHITDPITEHNIKIFNDFLKREEAI